MTKGINIEGSTGVTIGVDLGDKQSSYCLVTGAGEILDEGRVPTTSAALQRRFSGIERARILVEVGTHSPWVSRLLTGFGHEVVVVDPRKLDLIAQNDRKTDRHDAATLALLGRLDVNLQLLRTVTHRSEELQADLAVVRSRDALVRARTALILHVRGSVKSVGGRLPACSAPAFHRRATPHLPDSLKTGLLVVVVEIERLSEAIKEMDRLVVELATTKYEETEALRQVPGVGHLTALAFVLTLADPQRFRKSRQVGAYLGLIPRQRQSGERDPRLRITKAGDSYLRQLLVSAAHYVLGPFGPDCDLRRHGLQLAARGDKRRAVVAIARKLAVLLHRLWVTGEIFEPLRLATRKEQLVSVA